MRTQEYINKSLEKMGQLDIFGTRKEIKELTNILHDDERLLYIVSGFFDGNTWLISCTDERLIFLDKGMFFGLKQKEIPLDKINSIEHSKGFIMGKITVWDGASKITIENITNNCVNPMIDTINSAIANIKKCISKTETIPSSTNEDIVNKLERLAKLKESGILSEEEFQKSKLKIING